MQRNVKEESNISFINNKLNELNPHIKRHTFLKSNLKNQLHCFSLLDTHNRQITQNEWTKINLLISAAVIVIIH